MSWDLFIQDWGNTKSLASIPDDFVPKPIGKRSELIKKIKSVEPTANFSDPAWGILDCPTFSIEFNMGKEEEVMGFVMHIRGDFAALTCIEKILNELNLRASDMGSSDFFNLEKSQKSMEEWMNYRDDVIH